MTVSIEEVQKVLNSIMDSIKERGVLKIEISEDYYWDIVKNDLYKIENQPKKMTLGSLSDDIEEVRKINNGDYDPVAYNLHKVNAILRYISENTP